MMLSGFEQQKQRQKQARRKAATARRDLFTKAQQKDSSEKELSTESIGLSVSKKKVLKKRKTKKKE